MKNGDKLGDVRCEIPDCVELLGNVSGFINRAWSAIDNIADYETAKPAADDAALSAIVASRKLREKLAVMESDIEAWRGWE